MRPGAIGADRCMSCSIQQTGSVVLTLRWKDATDFGTYGVMSAPLMLGKPLRQAFMGLLHAAGRAAPREATAGPGFEPPPRVRALRVRLLRFMDEHVYEAEPVLEVRVACCVTVSAYIEQLHSVARGDDFVADKCVNPF